MRNAFGCLFFLVLLGVAGLFVRDYLERHPQDVPWTELRLSDPVGRFTSSKLAGLRDTPEQCLAMLRSAVSGDQPVPPRRPNSDCGYESAVRLEPAGESSLEYRPRPAVVSCPLAAAVLLFERRVVQPAAQEHFGTPVEAIEHAGTYSCRRLYGREEGRFSEHATANALDVTAFRLADGTRISIGEDWDAGGGEAGFLRDVRKGACRLFSTVLSPDYNEAHASHFHLDMAYRGRLGGGLCS